MLLEQWIAHLVRKLHLREHLINHINVQSKLLRTDFLKKRPTLPGFQESDDTNQSLDDPLKVYAPYGEEMLTNNSFDSETQNF